MMKVHTRNDDNKLVLIEVNKVSICREFNKIYLNYVTPEGKEISEELKNNITIGEEQKVDKFKKARETIKDLKLTEEEQESFDWLLTWESSTVENICNIIEKAKEINQ